jgi:16S rRNA (guanine527-N7)-methyltransferase
VDECRLGQPTRSARGVGVTTTAREVFGETYPLISRYVDILSTDAIAWGLVGPREADRLWERHVLNSVALSALVPVGASLVDVGSGAGLPGLPLAILRPDLTVTLLEPLLRRFTFLAQTVDKLGIRDTVRVVRGRAEEHNVVYDVVTARALAPLERLVHWCAPLRAPGGIILALKGQSAEAELAQAGSVIVSEGLAADVLSVRAHRDAEPATVVRLRSSG